MRLPLFYLSVFTNQPHGGNPAAVCLLNSWLDDEVLGKVATENNLSATAFLLRRGDTYEIRWFTRVRELKLCGHATMAAGFVVLNLLRQEAPRVEFTTPFHGTVAVEKRSSFLAMDLPAFTVSPCTAPAELPSGLGTLERPVEIVHGNQTYVVVFDGAEKVRKLEPRFDVLQQLHPHAVVATAPGEDADFVSRYFAPGYGIPEDPVTGSSHCILTPYWSKRLGKSRIHAQQLSSRGGELWCVASGDRVTIEGNAGLTMQGSLEI